MNLRVSKFLKGTILFSMLAVVLLMSSKTSFAAQSGNELDGIKTLEKDKVYEYDLNGDGQTEKLQYKITLYDDDYTVSIKLYINDKLCMSRKDHGFTYNLQLCDLDKSDNYLDIYGEGFMESDCISCSFFARYDENNKFKAIQFNPNKLNKNFNTVRYHLESLDGDGKFQLEIDTPIFSDAIGCYYCKVPFQLNDNTISSIPVKTYSFCDFSQKYQYKAAKSFSVYDKVGSMKVVYTVKSKDIVTFDKLYLSKSGKAYFRIINSKGKTGWLKPNQKNIFVEYPAWG